jgi:hypothetical protein
MWQEKKVTQATEGTMSIIERSKYLIDKVVLAHASTSKLWIYTDLLVLVLIIRVAG